MERNIKIYYIRQFFHNLLFILPVLVPFYQSLGFNLTQIFLLQCVAAIAATITNIPAGIIADRVGRKKVLLLRILIFNIWAFFYTVSVTYFEFIIAEICYGISFGLLSAEIPLISDTLLMIGKESKSTKIFSNGNSILILSLLTSSLALTLLIKLGYRFTIICTFFAIFVSLLIAFFGYKEPKLKGSAKNKNIQFHLRKTYDYCARNNFLFYFIIIGALFISLSYIGFWFLPSYFTLCQFPEESFGILFALTYTAELIATNLSYRIEKKIGKRLTILLINLAFMFGYLGMSVIFNIFAIFFIILRKIGYAFTIPIFNSYINEEITYMEKSEDSDIPTSRATIYSVYMLLFNLIFIILAPIMGFLADSMTLPFALLLMFIIFLILLIFNLLIFSSLKRKTNNKSSI